MGLAGSLQQQHRQTVLEMVAAADGRHLEALSLAEAQWPSGAVYLLGYVAEMHLKAAYARLVFGRAAAIVEWPDLVDQAKRDPAWRLLLTTKAAGGVHSLTLWKQLLLDARARQPGLSPLPATVRQTSHDVVDWLDRNWAVELRYAAEFATMPEFEAMKMQVEWLTGAYGALVGES
ncbi:MAG: hypothetical protein IT204_20090 [Fimbriimonadaceae bacterium]|nr:hypothetical protein [Fimbriimonadaceae bacterium]